MRHLQDIAEYARGFERDGGVVMFTFFYTKADGGHRGIPMFSNGEFIDNTYRSVGGALEVLYHNLDNGKIQFAFVRHGQPRSLARANLVDPHYYTIENGRITQFFNYEDWEPLRFQNDDIYRELRKSE